MTGKQLSKIGSKLATYLKEEFLDRNIKVAIAFRGLSGTSIASVVLSETHKLGGEIGSFYVRKKDEKSHGIKVEWGLPWLPEETETIIIVDDYVESGDTVKEIYQRILGQVPLLSKGQLSWGLCMVDTFEPDLEYPNFDARFMKYNINIT